jgi:uncharacterized protein
MKDTNQINLPQSDIDEILNIFHKYPQIEKALLFGSRANGTNKPGSDVDIAIFCKEPDINLKLAGELNDETLMPYHFDIIDYYKINEPELKEQIDKYGIIIYQR